MDRRRSLKMLGVTAVATTVAPVFAQERPIRIVLPYGAGGQTDTASRVLGEHMRKTLGRPVITENRPGGGAMIAIRHVQSAAPDGDTVLFYNWGLVTLPLLLKGANFDPIKDFDPVCMIGNGPNFLMVNDTVPARNIPEFLAWARAQKDPIPCANSGINTGGHIAAALLEKLGKIPLLHVPYKGSADVTNALVGDQAKMQVSVTTDALNGFIKSGRVRVLGIATRERSPLTPDLPTVGEFVPGYAVDGWYGILAPAGTPLDRREALAAAFRAALDDPGNRDRMVQLGIEVAYAGPAPFGRSVVASQASFAKIIELTGLQGQ